jgi:myo-inositol-1-phosphate synthase
MIKVIIIGSGNVAQHLIAAFQNSKTWDEIELVRVFKKSEHTGKSIRRRSCDNG